MNKVKTKIITINKMSEFQKKDIALIEIEIVAKTGQLNVEWNEYRKLLTSQICLVIILYFNLMSISL